ncbi:MAG: translation initiation factor IF-2 N-terminal domain-containing protein, partial [Clostridia bacterium]|nr:translation initiation factor IF-2 N-terminal domain-containing protein [Clostridia bacterium]
MGLHDKYRLHEISKDFDINSNEILAILTEYFGEAKTNHMTAL